jgi:hypothetical protein
MNGSIAFLGNNDGCFQISCDAGTGDGGGTDGGVICGGSTSISCPTGQVCDYNTPNRCGSGSLEDGGPDRRRGGAALVRTFRPCPSASST